MAYRSIIKISFAVASVLSLTGVNLQAKIVTDKEIQEINTLNSTKSVGPHWIAKDNWVNQLPKSQIKRMLGVQQAPRSEGISFEDPQFEVISSSEVFDWRAKDGQNWVSPILNQANCGSCVAFATVATLETQVNISALAPWLNPRFSPQALFACGGGYCDYGWQPASAANYVVSKGIPDEACAPYTEGATGQDVACSSICSDSAKRSTKAMSVTLPTRGSLSAAAVKAALKNGPLITTLTVYADFLTYSSGVYKHVTGAALGGHAVSIVGFDDAAGAWIVRNSWGTDWGDQGFIKMSYSDVSGIAGQTWGFKMPPVSGYVTMTNLADHDFLASVPQIALKSTFPDTREMNVSVFDANGVKVLQTASCAGADCGVALTTTSLTDGKYETVANAILTNGTTMSSERKYFYVANQKPTMNLSYVGSGVDLTKPLTDRIVLNVTASSSSVPFSSLTFQVKQNGKLVTSKTVDVVLASTTLGWRTNTVPNGTYQVNLLGRIKTNVADYVIETPAITVTTKN